eukprot:Selendium_serpulae@DN2216_c0_g1_i1.p1
MDRLSDFDTPYKKMMKGEKDLFKPLSDTRKIELLKSIDDELSNIFNALGDGDILIALSPCGDAARSLSLATAKSKLRRAEVELKRDGTKKVKVCRSKTLDESNCKKAKIDFQSAWVAIATKTKDSFFVKP